MCSVTRHSNLMFPPFPLQVLLSPLLSNSCLPSTHLLCSPVLLLPADVQTRSQHNSCPHRWHSPMPCSTAHIPWQSLLLSAESEVWIPGRLVWPGRVSAGTWDLGQLLRAGSFGWPNSDPYLAASVEGWAREALHWLRALTAGMGQVVQAQGTGHWVDEILKSHCGRFWYLALAGKGLC